MTDQPPHADAGDDVGARPGGGSIAGMPRWVKVLGMVALALVLLFVIVLLAGGGGHGPGRHTP